MHSLIRRQRDFQTYSEAPLVRLGARHAYILRDQETGKVLNRTGHRESICVGRCRFVKKEIEF